MPNPVPKKYTVQLGPSVTPETAGELTAWSEVIGVSTSTATRLAIERGMESLRGEWSRANGGRRPDPVRLAELIEEAAGRGDVQSGRRRRADRERRARETADSSGS